MRVLRVQRKKVIPNLIMATLVLVSLGVVIGGAVTGNAILIGAGAAGIFLICGAAMNLRERTQAHLV